MMVMPANNTHAARLHRKYPGRLGYLFGPNAKHEPYDVPFALDNGRYATWAHGKEWDESAFWKLIDWAFTRNPLWLVVPDRPADAIGTLHEWDQWEPRLRQLSIPLAIAVQDGMHPANVDVDADVVFIGGTTTWKRRTLWQWCQRFSRVHVGRINSERWLWECHKAGAESCDGTGWFRGDQMQTKRLLRYLKRSSQNLGQLQLELEFTKSHVNQR